MLDTFFTLNSHKVSMVILLNFGLELGRENAVEMVRRPPRKLKRDGAWVPVTF